MLGLTATFVALGLAAVLWREVPRWREDGTRSVPMSSVTSLRHLPACPARGKPIAIIGDSHVAGSRMSSGDKRPFGKVLQDELAGRSDVSLHGVGGDTAAMGEERWRDRDLPDTGLVMLAFGTNDAAPRGWLGRKLPVPLEGYKASLARQTVTWRERGNEVILMAPPPGGSRAIAARLAPYREAARDVGREMQVAVLDPADAFADCPSAQPVLVRDALHMNEAGNRCLGNWLARRLCSIDR